MISPSEIERLKWQLELTEQALLDEKARADDGWRTARTNEKARQEEMAKRDKSEAEVAALRTGDTCARQCEGTAYRIEARRLRAELAAIKGQEPVGTTASTMLPGDCGYVQFTAAVPWKAPLYTLPAATVADKDAERWRTYLKVYADEGMCAAEWDGPEAMTAYVDAAMVKGE